MNKGQKILIVKWCRETYGIPDKGGFNGLSKPTIPEDIMDVWKEIFPNDWNKFSRKKTIKEYPTEDFEFKNDKNIQLQKAFQILLKKLKKCGNLTMTQKYDEDTGEPRLVRSMGKIQIIEDYMVDVLEEMQGLKKPSSKNKKKKVSKNE